MEKDASEKTSNLIKEDTSFKDLQVNSNENQHNVGGEQVDTVVAFMAF